jgi:hypothetical protein
MITRNPITVPALKVRWRRVLVINLGDREVEKQSGGDGSEGEKSRWGHRLEMQKSREMVGSGQEDQSDQDDKIFRQVILVRQRLRLGMAMGTRHPFTRG